MLKKFGLSTLALAAALAVAVPTVSLAADRGGDHRGGRDFDRHEDVRRDDHVRGRGFGVGVYVAPTIVAPAPAPAANGYYDQYGVWHPYAYYPQPYGYGR